MQFQYRIVEDFFPCSHCPGQCPMPEGCECSMDFISETGKSVDLQCVPSKTGHLPVVSFEEAVDGWIDACAGPRLDAQSVKYALAVINRVSVEEIELVK